MNTIKFSKLLTQRIDISEKSVSRGIEISKLSIEVGHLNPAYMSTGPLWEKVKNLTLYFISCFESYRRYN